MVRELVWIGEIVSSHGNKGEIKVEPLTDFPERFKGLKSIYLVGEGRESIPVSVENVWFHRGYVILKLSNCNSIDEARQLRGMHLAVKKEERVKLPEGFYFIQDLLGFQVFTEEGEFIGVMIDIFKTGSNDVYIVKKEKGEIFIPATKEVVKEVDLKNRRIVIQAMEGLLEEQ